MSNVTRGRAGWALVLGCAVGLGGCGGAGETGGAGGASGVGGHGGTGGKGGAGGDGGAGATIGTDGGGSSDVLLPNCGANVSLQDIADAGSGSCVFALVPPPNYDQSIIALSVSDVLGGQQFGLPYDPTGTDGWDYVEGSNSTIQIYGAACAAYLAGTSTPTVMYLCLAH